MTGAYIDPLARVEAGVPVGDGSRIWANAHIRTGARVGRDCVIGENVLIDVGVTIGDRCKVQNNALVYRGAVLDEGAFVGPGAILTNDRYPRAILPSGEPKGGDDWTVSGVRVCTGATLGGQSVVVAGVTIGQWALVGAGSVVTVDVAPYTIVVGNPARHVGGCCRCGRPNGGAPCATCGYPELR